MQRRVLVFVSMVAVLTCTPALWAQGLPTGPRLLPYDGTLWQDGAPANGDHDFIFMLCSTSDASECGLLDYSASADPLDLANQGSGVIWVGTRRFADGNQVPVFQGNFSLMLGESQALTDAVFSTSNLYLGIAVRASQQPDLDFTELTNRQRITPSPYVHARQGGVDQFLVPRGAIMFFNLSTCPTGWSELTAASGRVLMGLPAGGTLGGTVGSALSDQGTRTITEVPAHSHSVDPPNTSGSARTSANGEHRHGYDIAFAEGDEIRLASVVTGHAIVDKSYTSPTYDHSHSVTVSINIPAFNSASTGASSVDVTMPYIQFLVCVKD